MILRRLLPILSLCVGLIACGDDGSSETTDTTAETTDATDPSTTSGSEETGSETGTGNLPPMMTCATFCVSYVETCLQQGHDDGWMTNDDCVADCEAWPEGNLGDETGDTLGCHETQLQKALDGDAAASCPEAGPNSTICT